MTDILDVTLSSERDREPLQMVSGEQLRKWQRIEAAARVAANNMGGVDGAARQALERLADALTGRV